MGHILSIDPSINKCGVAVFRDKELVHHQLIRPVDKTFDAYNKSLSVFQQLRAVRRKYKVLQCVLEVPVHWENEGFVARESGSIYKLALVVGMIYSLGDVLTVSPSGWKKQLPKDVVRNRLMPIYPDVITKELDHNVMDAIGIGHWYLFGGV